MFKAMFKMIKKLLLLFILLGAITTAVDYVRIMAGETPIFSIKEYSTKTRKQTFKGPFYVAERTVSASTKEKFVDSKNIKLKILFYSVNVPKQFVEKQFEFSVETKNEETCSESKLLYADRAIKIYTYCLEEINIIDNNTKKKDTLLNYLYNDYTIIDDIDSKLIFKGTEKDNTQGSTGTILKFTSDEDKFTNNGLVMYRCNKLYVNDVYVAPKDTPIREDFCKYKDDDFFFLYEVEIDPLPEGVEEVKTPEPFWEDQVNRYEFDTVQKDRVFITTPGIRGRAPKKIPLNDVLTQNILTLEQLAERGLKFNTIDKAKELEEKLRKEEEERIRKEQEQALQENPPTIQTPR